MARSRLSTAIEQGALAQVLGKRVAVFRPVSGHDLSPLSGFNTEIITGFFPDYEHFRSQGFSVSPVANGTYAGAVVFVPRAKALARSLIAESMAVTGGGPVIIDGQKADGIDSILKACRTMSASVEGLLSKAHGKVFHLTGGDYSAWTLAGSSKIDDGFYTQAGVFSVDGIDSGSAALAKFLPDNLTGKVADLGAGWGYLSHHILQCPKVVECHLIEAEYLALSCAKQNISDKRAQFLWANALDFESDSQFDHIVTNPPFHTGRAADHDLGRGFIAAAARLTRPGGTLWLVANRHLPYERALSNCFTRVEQVGDRGAFKVFKATGAGSSTPKTVQRRRR